MGGGSIFKNQEIFIKEDLSLMKREEKGYRFIIMATSI
jgi:hypothetical protein